MTEFSVEFVGIEEHEAEEIAQEVDFLWDYMDARVEEGVDPSDVAAALLVVSMMLGAASDDGETVH